MNNAKWIQYSVCVSVCGEVWGVWVHPQGDQMSAASQRPATSQRLVAGVFFFFFSY